MNDISKQASRYALIILVHLGVVIIWWLWVKMGEIPDYVMPTPGDTLLSLGEEYGWVHNLGYILNSLINSGLRIEFLKEYPFVSWQMFPFLVEKEGGWWHLPENVEKIPLTFTLKASKPQ